MRDQTKRSIVPSRNHPRRARAVRTPVPSFTTYRCPPLLAWISTEQCRFNQRRARDAATAEVGTEARTQGMAVSACLGCPGVSVLNAGTRIWTRGRRRRSVAARGL